MILKISENEHIKQSVSAFFGGLGAGILVYPLDILRIRSIYKHKTMGPPSSYMNGIGFSVLSSGLKAITTFAGQMWVKDTCEELGTSELSAQNISALAVGIINPVALSPMNIIKTRMQAATNKRSVACIARCIYKQYGSIGFFRGLSPLLFRDLTWSLVYFNIFGDLKHKIDHATMGKKETIPKENVMYASIIASTAGTIVSYPLDAMRLFRQHESKNYSLLEGFRIGMQINKHNRKAVCYGLIRNILQTTFSHIGFYLFCDFLLCSPHAQKNLE